MTVLVLKPRAANFSVSTLLLVPNLLLSHGQICNGLIVASELVIFQYLAGFESRYQASCTRAHVDDLDFLLLGVGLGSNGVLYGHFGKHGAHSSERK